MRQPYKQRTIRLVGELQRETAINMLRNAPLDPERPLQLVLREEPKGRRLDQNAAMWAGPIADIAAQAWVDGRQFSAEVWHEHFKREFLPDVTNEELPLLVKDPEKYRKYDHSPSGHPILVGSTTDLTERGFARYLTQIEAFGAGLGVMFHEPPARQMVA